MPMRKNKNMDAEKQLFMDVVMAIEDRLYRLALNILKDPHEAEDALSEAILRAWENRETLKEEGKLRVWLHNIVLNTARNMLKKQKRVVLCDEVPETAYEDELDHVFFWLDKLDERERTILLLRYYEGYTQPEIGKILHIPEGTVKSRLHAARKHLREIIGDDFDGEF